MTTAYDAGIPYDSVLGYDGGQPIVTSNELPTWSLDVLVPDTGVRSALPEATIDSLSFEDSAPAAVSFTVANTSVGASLLDHLSVVILKANGVEVRDGRWLLRGKGWNAGRKTQVKQFTGRSLLWDRLDFTVVQPGVRKLYSGKTPGFILNDLFLEAQARDVGYWDSFTWTFDALKDSNGNAWPVAIGSLEYLPSAKYSDIVANLVDKGVIQISLQGNEIRATVPDTDGVNRSALLVVGQDVTDAPQQESSDNLLSDVVVLGDDSIAVVRANTETRAKYWREEGGISQGGTKDVGTLSIFGDVALSGGAEPKVQRTYALVITQARPFLPLRDYVVGDWVRTQHADDTPAQSYRVKQIVLKQEKGHWSGTLVLNDKFLENEIRLTKKVQGIIGGATITGSAQTSTPDNSKDDTIPNPPDGVVGQAITYVDSNGITKVQVSFGWNPPALNTDGSLATDIDHYRVAWRYSDDDPLAWRWQDTSETTFFLSPLDPNRDLLFFVRAIDTTGHWSGNQPSPYVLHLGGDTTPPPKPSGVLSLCINKILVVEWDGLTSTGATMPSDFDHINVYTSSVNDFDVYLDGTLRGTLNKAGQLSLPMYANPIGSTVYVKFVAVDKSGNLSPASDNHARTVTGITGADITANSITTNNIAAGAITSQLINAGAINADKISLGQTVNLVQDPSFNNADWRARRLTTAWAENPLMWFFTTGFIDRNGYYLQALSRPDGQNGGRMYVTDYIYTQLGESYYFGMYMRNGQFTPNPEATMRMGIEVVKKDGTVLTDGISYAPFAAWTKYGYRFTIIDQDWVKIRYYIRADNLTAGDIAVDDLEVRGGVGTTEYTGSRGLIDPQGLEAYDANNLQTVLIDFRTGDATFRGTIKSGFTGKRIEVNPSTTYLPEIRFYPEVGDNFAYINASDNVSTDFPFIGVNAPDNPVTNISNAMILYDNGVSLGAINKTDASIQSGIAINGMTKATSEVVLYGKLSYNTEAHRLFSGGQFNAGSPTLNSSNAVVAVIGKPAAPPAGTRWVLQFTPQRAAADKFFPIATQDTSTQTTLACYPNTTWVTTGNPPMYINFVFWRIDT